MKFIKFIASIVLTGGLIVVSPTPAHASDYRKCVTYGEASSLAHGQTRGVVRKLLDGPGTKQPDAVWWYPVCNKPSKTHRIMVWFKNGKLDGAVQIAVANGEFEKSSHQKELETVA